MPYCTYVGWHKHRCTQARIYVSTALVTDSAAFKNSKNIWTRHAGCTHTYTDTHIRSREAVVELRTQQGWLPEGVSRRWAEIRLCDCDCMSERICTPQQFSIPCATHTHTHTCTQTLHNTTHKHIPTNFYICSLHHLQQCTKTGSLDSTRPACMTEFLVYYNQVYSILASLLHQVDLKEL